MGLLSVQPDQRRYLLVTADDFGIGPETSRAILELGQSGILTTTVLLVNSPYAEEAVRHWNDAGRPIELGWHPCLTLDRPVLSADQVPSLVDAQGRFHPLGQLLKRWLGRRIDGKEVGLELKAQWERYCQLVGEPPVVVNGHHHLHILPPMAAALKELLGERRPYLRRVREPFSTWAKVPGARFKRAILNGLGRWASHGPLAAFPGADWLAGITDPPFVRRADFFRRWLRTVPGRFVELTCHPGYWDETLIGRDGTAEDGQLQRRVDELALLKQESFREAVAEAGFTPITAAALLRMRADQ